MTFWNTIGGVGSIAVGLYWLSIDLPAQLSWAPWGCWVGGVLLLPSAAISTLIRERPR